MARAFLLLTYGFLVVLATGVNTQTSTRPPATTTATPPPLPSLPGGALQLNIEATIRRTDETSGAQRLYTTYLEDYIDPSNNRGMSIMINGSMETRYYYDLSAGQGMTVSRDVSTTPLNQAVCSVSPLLSQFNMSGGFSVEKVNGKFIISNISRLFHWSANSSALYLGTQMVRGIQANVWSLPVQNTFGPNAFQYNLTYYFSADHVMPYFGKKSLPLRIEMRGSMTGRRGSANFQHVYEVNLVAPLANMEDNFFATPKGVYCQGRTPPAGTRPYFANQFSANEELVRPINKLVSNIQLFYDYPLNLTRSDYELTDHHVYGTASLSIVRDFNQNFEMVINKNNGTCKVTRIPTSGGFVNWDLGTDDKGNPRLMHTSDMPWAKNLHFQGYRMERGQSIHVWSNMRQLDDGKVQVAEIWFADPAWSVRALGNLNRSHSVHVGFYNITYDKNTHAVTREMQSNCFNQFYGDLDFGRHLASDIFEVADCYSRDELTNEHLRFKMFDTERLYVNKLISKESIVRAVRSHLSSAVGISLTRLTNIQVFDVAIDEQSAFTVLELYFILRAKLLLDSADAADKTANQVENGQVVTKLEALLASEEGITFYAAANDGHEAKFLITSLLYNDEGSISDEILGSKTTNAPTKTYSAASMAGLGIGMILLGAVLTVAIGGVVWVKRFDINLPYTTQSNE